MTTTLDKIVDYKKQELESLRRRVSLKDVQNIAADAKPAQNFLENFEKEGFNIIAEIKKASPSFGVIRPDFKPLDIAQIYEENGAKALSVLTDEHFFQGSLEILQKVRSSVSLPCLRKDFTLDEYHVFEARGAGADAILLIAAILEPSQIKDYQALAVDLGMSVLVEIHNLEEWERVGALFAAPSIVGVNNRDLKSFKVDLTVSHDLAQVIPAGVKKISESGIKTHDDLVSLQKFGFDGFLIGETLMREKDIGKKLRELLCPS